MEGTRSASYGLGAAGRRSVPLVRGMPAYPIGIVLIARLALAQDQQGAGLGTRLSADGVRMAVIAGESVAARLVVVDAIDDQPRGSTGGTASPRPSTTHSVCSAG